MSEALPEPLFTEEAIAARVTALARTISSDYAGRELFLVGILRGAFIFLADLSRRLTVPRRVDFVALASYGDSARPQEVRLVMDLRSDVAGRHVLVVDDIVDQGHTLAWLLHALEARGPASLRACVLLRKIRERAQPLDVDYVGFDIPDVWVVGYGLDYADRHRTLPYIGVVRLAPES